MRITDEQLAVLKGRVREGGPDDGWSLDQEDKVAADLIDCRAELAALRGRAETAEGLLSTCRARFDVASDTLLRIDVRVALLEGLLREVEWAAQNVDDEQCCPVCEGLQYSATLSYGHDSDCRLAAALADGEAR